MVADTVRRFARVDGRAVFLQTGTDEHGDKIVQAAAAAGVAPRDYVDEVSAKFRSAWSLLLVEPDNFVRTTDPAHITVVQGILQKIYEQGDIYFSDYEGLYCQGCERFLTEKELSNNKCPDHLTHPEKVAEQNYFFRMGRYQQWLLDHIKANPDFITPTRYRNEIISFLRDPLADLCISRPISRLDWGIPLPFDQNFVTYVWFDALINYISGIDYPSNRDFVQRWAGAEHLIAKDILKPHAIFWPIMLKAMGLTPYRRLHVHGYWNVDETKMSKSIGNVIRPEELVADFGVDSVRYFLLREMSFGLDASYSAEAMRTRHNFDLANDLGNLFSRSLTMVKNFANGQVPTPGSLRGEDQELVLASLAMLADYRDKMRAWAFRQALETVWELIGRANRYIVANAPWELAKDPTQAQRLATVLNTLLETLRCIAGAMGPIMPEASAKMAAALGFSLDEGLTAQRHWGRLAPGSKVNLGENLFPRIKAQK